MQYKLFCLLASGNAVLEEEMNLFIRTHRVVNTQKVFGNSGDSAFWYFCVEYIAEGSPAETPQRSGRNPIDYKDILSDEEFAVFVKLRDLRKRLAHQDGVPVYSVATNEQFAQMVQNRYRTISDLKKISGLGEGKLNKYGTFFLSILSELPNESDSQSDRNDRGHGEPLSRVAENDPRETG